MLPVLSALAPTVACVTDGSHARGSRFPFFYLGTTRRRILLPRNDQLAQALSAPDAPVPKGSLKSVDPVARDVSNVLPFPRACLKAWTLSHGTLSSGRGRTGPRCAASLFIWPVAVTFDFLTQTNKARQRSDFLTQTNKLRQPGTPSPRIPPCGSPPCRAALAAEEELVGPMRSRTPTDPFSFLTHDHFQNPKNGTCVAIRRVMLAPKCAIWLWMYVRNVRLVHRPCFMIVIRSHPLSFIAMAPPARSE